MESISLPDIITPPVRVSRPPEPLPPLVNGGYDRDYDEPIEPQPQDLIAPTTATQGPSLYDNEMRVPHPSPPLPPPPLRPPRSPPKESAATASTISPAKSHSSSIIEEKGDHQNTRASDLRPPDILENKVTPVSHRRHSEANANATNRLKKSLPKAHSSPLSELRSPSNANMPQPAAGESQLCGSYSPAQLHLERTNSVPLDAQGYVICVL